MGILKNICLRVALNKEQRLVIWNALQYSDHKYRKHGNVGRAVVTSMVISQTEKRFGVSEKNFTKEEVNAILGEFARRVKAERKEELQDAYESGRDDAIREILENIKHGRGLVVGEVIEMEEEPEEKEQNKETSAPEPSTAPTEGKAEEETHTQDAGEQQ